MQCIALTADGRVDSVTPVTSADQCPTSSLLVAEPGDPGSTSLPPTDQLATAWGVSFGLVVGCYAIARQVGTVVSMLK